MERIRIIINRIAPWISLIIFLSCVFWFTFLGRGVRANTPQLELFWSYRRLLAGNVNLAKEIALNIAFFLPIGFLLSSCLRCGNSYSSSGKKIYLALIGITVILSLTIELCQLVTMRGLFEWDDIISNTIGAILGICFFQILTRCRHGGTLVSCVVLLCIIISAGLIIERDRIITQTDESPRAFFFQLEQVECSGLTVTMTGFAFRIERPAVPVHIYLRETATGKIHFLSTTQCNRFDVNEYFSCEFDYTNTGFCAIGEIQPGVEYELLVRFPFTILFSTGVYLNGSDFHYIPEQYFQEPTDRGDELDSIIKSGTLLVYRPDYHCWVYQLGNCLYWIVDEGFNFEDDGTTYIQYQLWTTQTERLPEERLANNWLWDNIGGNFEDFELTGDFGNYRVCCRELPAEYAVIAIVTGYYKNGEWIWQNYFRPLINISGSDYLGY